MDGGEIYYDLRFKQPLSWKGCMNPGIVRPLL